MLQSPFVLVQLANHKKKFSTTDQQSQIILWDILGTFTFYNKYRIEYVILATHQLLYGCTILQL